MSETSGDSGEGSGRLMDDSAMFENRTVIDSSYAVRRVLANVYFFFLSHARFIVLLSACILIDVVFAVMLVRGGPAPWWACVLAVAAGVYYIGVKSVVGFSREVKRVKLRTHIGDVYESRFEPGKMVNRTSQKTFVVHFQDFFRIRTGFGFVCLEGSGSRPLFLPQGLFPRERVVWARQYLGSRVKG